MIFSIQTRGLPNASGKPQASIRQASGGAAQEFYHIDILD